ncbi:MAG: hypothetical protein HY876_06315 [Coriobacteriales bacterium]|nr:hypothetical protein [Coriobacteriales bacterium]
MNGDLTTTASWHFLDEVAFWTLGISVIGMIVAIGLGYLTFAVSWALVLGADVALVHFAARRGGRAAEAGTIDRGALFVFAGARFGVKAALLVLAAFVPNVLNFWGAVVGAVAYDLGLTIVGSALALRRYAGNRR